MVTYLFPPEFGGAIVQAIRLSRELISRGYRVSFLTDNGSHGDSFEDFESIPVFRRWTLSSRHDSIARQLMWVFRIVAFALRHPRFRIFHFHSVRGPELMCMPILRLLGRRTILKLTLAGSDDPLTLSNKRLLGRIYSFCLHRIDRIVAISPMLRDMSLSAGIAPERLILVANGVDANLFYFPSSDHRESVRATIGIGPRIEAILSVGSIEHRKGYDLLIQAFSSIHRERPNTVLLIVGPGNNAETPEYLNLLKLIEELGVDGVSFLGSRDDVPDLMMAADLFAFCSRQEGLPNVIIEAMCCGLGLVTMDIEGITDWIVTGRKTAVNVASRDPSDFSSECLKLLENRDQDLSRSEAERASAQFGMPKIADCYDEVYQALL